jgi:hypothetical protein
LGNTFAAIVAALLAGVSSTGAGLSELTRYTLTKIWASANAESTGKTTDREDTESVSWVLTPARAAASSSVAFVGPSFHSWLREVFPWLVVGILLRKLTLLLLLNGRWVVLPLLT